MPTYNGSGLDEIAAGRGPVQQWTSGNASPASDHAARTGGQGTLAAGYSNPAFAGMPGFSASGAFGGGGAGGAGGGVGAGGVSAVTSGGGGGSGASLGGPIGDAYSRLIAQGGSPYSASQQARLANMATEPIARGTNDAIQAARMDAVRRGDTSGSSLGDVEGRIRTRGAADAGRARFAAETGMSQQALSNLLASLQGAGGYQNDQIRNEVLAGQLQAQAQSGMASGLNLLMGI